ARSQRFPRPRLHAGAGDANQLRQPIRLRGHRLPAGARQPIEPLLVALVERTATGLVDLLDPAVLVQLVERAVERGWPQSHLAIAELVDVAGDRQPVTIAGRERQ